MKNNDLKEFKPIYIHETSLSYNDEISMVELVKILINRKKLIGLILICFISAGVAAALIAPPKYTFSASIEIGSQVLNGDIKTFDSPETLLAKIQHNFIPQSLTELQNTGNDNKNKYRIKASIPKNSSIIVLEVKETKEKAKLIEMLLDSITQKAINDHKRIYDSIKHNLESQINVANTKLTNLGSDSDNQAEKNRLQGNIETLSVQLTSLRNTRTVIPTIRSIEPTGMSRRLIVILAGAIGLFTAVFAAFFTEFATKVRGDDRD